MRYVAIQYKCVCMKEEAVVQVPERRADEDILDWMAYVQMELAVAHRNRSPLCVSGKIEYCKIPLRKDGGGIGFADGGTA